jgi:hypothetical protein
VRRIRAFLCRIGGLFNKRRRDHDLTAEFESHLQMHIDDNLRAPGPGVLGRFHRAGAEPCECGRDPKPTRTGIGRRDCRLYPGPPRNPHRPINALRYE